MIDFKNKHLNIAVIMGGKSAERNVSLRSGAAVVQALKTKNINAVAIDGVQQLLASDIQQFDAVFNILHGEAGENGELAGLLSSLSIKYTGCDMTGAVLSWHKDIAKTLITQAGLTTPQSQTINNIEELQIKFNGPWIIKPTQEGSSVGLYFAQDEIELNKNCQLALQDVDSILIEQFIKGTECTVAVIKDQALPVIRIIPEVGLYDYEAKYRSQGTQYFCPSGLDEHLEQALKKDALTAFNALSLKGWGRVDFIVDDKGKRWFLEANTTPGMTETSLVPKAAKAIGWSFEDLVLQILSTAFENGDYEYV